MRPLTSPTLPRGDRRDRPVPTHARRAAARGAAALGLTLALLAAAALLSLSATRQVLLDLRLAGRETGTVQAFEAADAGLDWALAMLNAAGTVDAQCRPHDTDVDTDTNAGADAGAGPTFRDRALTLDPVTGAYLAHGIEAACSLDPDGGWSCACPASSGPPPIGPGPAAFRVAVLAGRHPGTVRLRAVGCAPAVDGGCPPAAGATSVAVARHETLLALLPALAAAPTAAVTLRGRLASETAMALANPDPGTGLAVHAGGRVALPPGSATGAPGAPAAEAVLDQDAMLATASADEFFRRHFGATREAWASQPAIQTLTCAAGDCGLALAARIDAAPGLPAVHVTGDLALAQPRVFGTPARPVVLVVDGDLRIDAEVVVHGVVQANRLETGRGAAGTAVHGAVLLDGDLAAGSSLQVVRAAPTLALLQRGSGGLVRVNGAWQDF